MQVKSGNPLPLKAGCKIAGKRESKKRRTLPISKRESKKRRTLPISKWESKKKEPDFCFGSLL
jgi:hypothetical protein